MALERLEAKGLSEVLAALKSLPPEIAGKAGGPVKLALKRAADLFLIEAKKNVRATIDEPNQDNDNRSTGLLLLSLQSRRANRKPAWLKNGEAYYVGVKPRQAYPDTRQGRAERITTEKTARLLEYGSERRAPMPWLRPAFDSKKVEAIELFRREVSQRTQKLIDKHRNTGSRR